MSCLNSVTDFTLYSEITRTVTSIYCLLSYFENEILINLGSWKVYQLVCVLVLRR